MFSSIQRILIIDPYKPCTPKNFILGIFSDSHSIFMDLYWMVRHVYHFHTSIHVLVFTNSNDIDWRKPRILTNDGLCPLGSKDYGIWGESSCLFTRASRWKGARSWIRCGACSVRAEQVKSYV